MPDSAAGNAAGALAPCEVLEEVSAIELIASWRSDFGLDVSTAFVGVERLRLCRDLATGRIFFDPPVVGPPNLYAKLRRFDFYQPAHKAEHGAAARWIAADSRILDVGAGDGRFATYVPDARYVGLETDDEAVATARSLGRSVAQGTLSQIARGGGAFDVVTAFQVLEHVANSFDFAAKAVACLADDGLLILAVPDGESYLADLPDFMLNAPPHHVTWWTGRALRQLAQDLGLTVLSLERFAVEPWERRLWWMARAARFLAPWRRRRFGRYLRPLKILSWLAAGLLVHLPIGQGRSRGATLLLVAQKPRPSADN